jgi:calcium-dependent protein kinase
MGGCCSRDMKKKNLIESSKTNEDFKKKFEYISTLGDGAFGKVKLYRDRLVHEMKFAIKTMKKSELSNERIDSIKHEVEVLKKLDHPNIVKYFDTYEDESCIHIVMEYIPGENLMQIIKQKKINKFDERTASVMIKCLLKAIMFLHIQNIIHRDIKPENILFSIIGDPESLKLIDFGLSVNEDKVSKVRAGSPNFMAPETLSKKYTKKSDAWSIGVTIHMLLTGKLPFHGSDNANLFDKILHCNYNKKFIDDAPFSREGKDLIKSILIFDQKLRFGVEDILNSSWIKKFEVAEEINNRMILKFFENNNIVENFRKFEKYSNFKKEILFSIAKLSQDDEVRQLKKIFMEFDKDSSGSIEKEEVKNIFLKLGMTSNDVKMKLIKEEMDMMWRSLDFHRDGTVNYTEFLAASLSSSVNFCF